MDKSMRSVFGRYLPNRLASYNYPDANIYAWVKLGFNNFFLFSVGNIPYEATEEKLKDIFSEVGPVLSFKLVFDRETGKPKGYGFCEYKDQETALSAMRNLNGYEIGGRSLRVDNACTEKSRMEMQALMQGPQVSIFLLSMTHWYLYFRFVCK